jgi:hypothetical protein
MPTYTSPFTGDVVQPTDVSYYALTFSTSQELSWPDYTVSGATTVAAARIMDCTATAAGLTITLPPGNQQSVGTDILFRNLGAESFTIQDQSGGQAVVLAAGTARYFYLVDNSTEDGVYRNFTYGTGTSAADAAALAGSGLVDIAGQLATSTTVIQTSLNTTFTEANRAEAYVWTGGAGTFTLPTVSSLTPGWYMMIRNGGTGTLSVAAPATKTINGNSSEAFYPSDSAVIIYEHTTGNFFTVGLPRQAAISYTSATYDVDAIIGNTLSLVTFAPSIQTYVAPSGTRTTDLDVVLPAITQIYAINNATGQSGYDITFQISGSTQAPVAFANGTTAILLSDGVNLYILTQTSTTTFLGANGSAAAPTFSFLSDSETGMYLNATNNLRLAANATDMLIVDATNLGNLQVSTPATFTAGKITGGSF